MGDNAAMPPSVRLSVVVPCYNEVGGIAELHRRIGDACMAAVGDSYEIVLVNDGSDDGSRDAIARLCASDGHVVLVDLSRNYGHQTALTAGLDFCRGARVFIVDADLQDPPEHLGAMMAKMDEGYDVVYGQRLQRQGENWFKKSTASIFYRLLGRLVDIDVARDTGDFRLMSRRAVDHLQAMPEKYRFIRGMVSWIGLRQAPYPYVRQPRFAGETHYPLKKMLGFAVDAISSFSIVPLRLASYLGLTFGLLGFLALAYTIFSWATNRAIPGWTSLACIVLILGSVQLMVLGIFGEYLGRMYMETKRRPLYIVDEVISSRAEEREAPAEPEVRRLQAMLRERARA
jgi:dolichol-phosphate mannosyltransferase